MRTRYKTESQTPTSVIVERLRELSHAVTQGKGAIEREFTMRIPAEPDRDADLVLRTAAKRLEAAATWRYPSKGDGMPEERRHFYVKSSTSEDISFIYAARNYEPNWKRVECWAYADELLPAPEASA